MTPRGDLTDVNDEPRIRRRLLLDWLERRAPAEAIETVETHILIVAFQGDRVYKMKKAVEFAFVDLSTPELREADCLRDASWAHPHWRGVAEKLAGDTCSDLLALRCDAPPAVTTARAAARAADDAVAVLQRHRCVGTTSPAVNS